MRLPGRDDLERAAWIHVALVLATGAALLLPGGVPWPLTAPANLLLALTALALPLAGVLAWRRRLAPAVAELACVVVGLVAFGADLRAGSGTTRPAERVAREARVRVLSFNLGVGLASGEDVASRIVDLRPDVLVLVELTERIADELLARAGAALPHRAVYPRGIDGRAVLSRFPIVEEELIVLGDGRPYLRCVLDARGRPLEVWSIHLAPSVGLLGSASSAGRDLERILERTGGTDALVLAGDFNTTERSGSHARLVAAGLTDAFAAAGEGLGATFPIFGRYFGLPVFRFLRIDYVWSGPALEPVAAWVERDLGSDHRPLVADLVWRGTDS